VFKGEDYQLRLLPRPVHRYADEGAGIVDGALFAFTYGTNPEVFLQIEARREETDRPRWRVSFARSSAAAVAVTRDGMTVWSAEAYERVGFRSGRLLGLNPRDPYFSVWGPDPLPESP
jgi:hypothetical protein